MHKGEVEIEGDMATLADKNIFPGDVLWVKDSEIHENRDIAGESLILSCIDLSALIPSVADYCICMSIYFSLQIKFCIHVRQIIFIYIVPATIQ